MLTVDDRGTLWERAAADYCRDMVNDYHSHRLSVIQSMIPAHLYQPGKRILDFGCGDGVLFPPFVFAGASVVGIDSSPAMVHEAWERGNIQATVGTVADLEAIPSESLDALLCFNTLAYLTESEEHDFYSHARRMVKPGGYLIVTHCNELFELFGLNEFTAEFFRRHLVTGGELPALTAANRAAYHVRENPLTYRHKLARWGFAEQRQEFVNRHTELPTGPKTDYPNTLGVPECERWKMLFQCSTFGSMSVRDSK